MTYTAPVSLFLTFLMLFFPSASPVTFSRSSISFLQFLLILMSILYPSFNILDMNPLLLSMLGFAFGTLSECGDMYGASIVVMMSYWWSLFAGFLDLPDASP